AALRMQSLASVFETSLPAVFDHFRAPLAVPMCVRGPGGRQFHISARFNGPARSVLAGFDPDEAVARPTPATPAGATPATGAENAFGPGEMADNGRSARMSGLRYLSTGESQIDTVVSKVQRILNKDIPLLILGETGTGKELLARAVHHDSSRARQP